MKDNTKESEEDGQTFFMIYIVSIIFIFLVV